MIKTVQTKDYLLLANLNEEIQTLHHTMQPKIFKPYNRNAVIDFFKNIINNEDVLAFVATDNDTALGYVLLFSKSTVENAFQYARRFVLLDQIVVLKAHQSKGVGKVLLEATFSYAKENKFDCVELNHWTLNESARIFFTKNKFEYYNEKMWRAVK